MEDFPPGGFLTRIDGLESMVGRFSFGFVSSGGCPSNWKVVSCMLPDLWSDPFEPEACPRFGSPGMNPLSSILKQKTKFKKINHKSH
jgi:hypothetical protein